MSETPRTPRPSRPRKGSSSRERARWRATYESTPFDQLPWFLLGPSYAVQLAVESGFLPRGASTLDVGCGAGSNLLYLAERGFRPFGVDLSPVAVAAARSRAAEAHLTIDVREGDALALPFANESFPSLVDNGCFHTIPLRSRARYAQEVHRVLVPGGRFVLSWVAREHVGPHGPPHRPSLGEVTALLESRFLFARTGFLSSREADGPPMYFAFLERRTTPYPPRR